MYLIIFQSNLPFTYGTQRFSSIPYLSNLISEHVTEV